MILFIQCVVCCLLFTLAILPTQYKDPINMIMSYPPKIRQRVEELPQYKETIKQRGKIHIGKKILGLIFFVIILSSVAYCPDVGVLTQPLLMYLYYFSL